MLRPLQYYLENHDPRRPSPYAQALAVRQAVPAALAAAKQALASLYAERLSALDAVLESATAVRDAIRAGAPLPVADDVSVAERVSWDDEVEDEEEEGRKRKKKRKKKR